MRGGLSSGSSLRLLYLRSGVGEHKRCSYSPLSLKVAALLIVVVALCLTGCGSSSSVQMRQAIGPWTFATVGKLKATSLEGSMSCVGAESCVVVDTGVSPEKIELLDASTAALSNAAIWGSSQPPDAVQCVGPTECLIASHDCSRQQCHGMVTRQPAPGGSSTVQHFSDATSSNGRVRLSCAPRGTMCAAAAAHVGGIDWMITSDFGRHWILSATSVSNGVPYVEALSCGSMTCVGAVDEGSPGHPVLAIYKTGNGGSTWREATLESRGRDEVVGAIACGSATNCVAVTDRDTLISNDAGSTWTLGASTAPRVPAYVSCAGTAACVSLTLHGEVGWTDSAGQQWTWQPVNGVEWTGLACPDPSDCVLTAHPTSGGGLWFVATLKRSVAG